MTLEGLVAVTRIINVANDDREYKVQDVSVQKIH
jgi:hypothetical protein